MISDEELLELPDDPELAFVQYERQLREKIFRALETSEGGSTADIRTQYVNYILAAVKALNLDILQGWEVPQITKFGTSDSYYQLLSDVDHFTVQIRFKNARRIKRYSVALNASTKEKLRHYLEKIRSIVDRLEVSDKKREALYQKISALVNEIDRDRTRFDAAMALVLESSSVAGKAADKLKPLKKFIDSVTGLLREAKEEEDNSVPMLPPRDEPKRLEPPRLELKQPLSKQDLDDDIPF